MENPSSISPCCTLKPCSGNLKSFFRTFFLLLIIATASSTGFATNCIPFNISIQANGNTTFCSGGSVTLAASGADT